MKPLSIKITDDIWERIQKDIPRKYATISELVRDVLREKYGLR